MGKIVVYDGPPSEPIKRDVLIFPNGTVWYANDVTDEDYKIFQENCRMTVKSILEELENGEKIVEVVIDYYDQPSN